MKKMLYEIKQKLRQYANLQMKVAKMAKEIDEMIERIKIWERGVTKYYQMIQL